MNEEHESSEKPEKPEESVQPESSPPPERTPESAHDPALDAVPDAVRPEQDLASSEPLPPTQSRRVSDANPIKRKLVTALIGLYAISVVAAGAVLWRSQANGGSDDISDSSGIVAPAAGIIAAMKKKDSVGYVTISGPIYRSSGGRMFEKGVQQWGRKIEMLAKKKDVKAIVLAINSPGGSVGAVQELYDTINRVRKESGKPIVAHLGDVAASGGYYLAAACDKIVAHPGTLVGSIGVIFAGNNIEGLLKKIGVKSRVIKSGKMKDIGSMSRPMTEEERALLQALIDDTYGQFLKAVVDGRGMSEEKVRPLADGRIFTGAQSLKNGLVDELGNTHDAIMLAAKLGGIKDKHPKIYRDTESISSILEFFETRLAFMRSPESLLLEELRQHTYTGLEYRWGR